MNTMPEFFSYKATVLMQILVVIYHQHV